MRKDHRYRQPERLKERQMKATRVRFETYSKGSFRRRKTYRAFWIAVGCGLLYYLLKAQ